MKLLVIEDDREAAAYVGKGLSESGYVVDLAPDGRTGLFMASSGNYEALIIDRMLPGMDGLALLTALRAAEIRTPVLILSALGAVDDRVKGLRAGGDDYLAKPFAFVELVARLQALLRRGSNDVALEAGGLRLDPVSHSATDDSGEVALTPTEFRLLACLMSRPGEAVRRRELVRAGWPHGAIVRENTLDAYVARLRRKLKQLEHAPEIATVHGVGYRVA